LQVEFSWKYHC